MNLTQKPPLCKATSSKTADVAVVAGSSSFRLALIDYDSLLQMSHYDQFGAVTKEFFLGVDLKVK